MRNRSSSGKKRKGISLSLSYKNSSLQKPTFKQIQSPNNYYRFNVNQVPKVVQIPEIKAKPQIISTHRRPSPIVYRLRKSQWQQLQQNNNQKIHQINKMKCQLNQLNTQMAGLEKKEWKRQQNQIARKQFTLLEKNQNICINTSNKDKELQKENQNMQQRQLHKNYNTFSFSDLDAFNIQKIAPNDHSIVRKQPTLIRDKASSHLYKQIKNKQNFGQEITVIEEVQKTSKNIFQEKVKNSVRNNKVLIDIKTLQDIQSRLNKLIDETKF